MFASINNDYEDKMTEQKEHILEVSKVVYEKDLIPGKILVYHSNTKQYSMWMILSVEYFKNSCNANLFRLDIRGTDLLNYEFEKSKLEQHLPTIFGWAVYDFNFDKTSYLKYAKVIEKKENKVK